MSSLKDRSESPRVPAPSVRFCRFCLAAQVLFALVGVYIFVQTGSFVWLFDSLLIAHLAVDHVREVHA